MTVQTAQVPQIPPIPLTQESFVSIARDLIEIADTILKNVVTQTEQAAMSIGEKIQHISTLSEEQALKIRNLLTDMYTDGTEEQREIEAVSVETNAIVDQILESAEKGDFESVKNLGDSAKYSSLKKKSGKLAQQLEHLSKSDEQMGEMLCPVIMALQFQDSIRQSLENVVRSFNVFFHTMSCLEHQKLPKGIAEEFWSRIEGQFTTVTDRNVVRTVVFGPQTVNTDVVESGDPFFF